MFHCVFTAGEVQHVSRSGQEVDQGGPDELPPAGDGGVQRRRRRRHQRPAPRQPHVRGRGQQQVRTDAREYCSTVQCVCVCVCVQVACVFAALSLWLCASVVFCR